MAKYRFWQAPALAFFSKSLWNDVAENWGGCGALYIFILSSLAWFASATIWFFPLFQLAQNKDVAAFCEQLPKMNIVDGKMEIDKQSPYFVKDHQTGVPLVLFAMDRETTQLKPTDPPVVVTKNAVVLREHNSNYANTGDTDVPAGDRVFELSELSQKFPQLELDGPSILAAFHQILLMVPIAVMIVFWPFVFLNHVIQLLIFGGIGMAIASGMRKNIQFDQSMRLAAMAITPNVVLSVLMVCIPHPAQSSEVLVRFMIGWSAMSCLIALVYMAVIIRSLPATEVRPTV